MNKTRTDGAAVLYVQDEMRHVWGTSAGKLGRDKEFAVTGGAAAAGRKVSRRHEAVAGVHAHQAPAPPTLQPAQLAPRDAHDRTWATKK